MIRRKQFSKTRQLKEQVAQLTEQLNLTTEIQFKLLDWLKSNLTEEQAAGFKKQLGKWMEDYETTGTK